MNPTPNIAGSLLASLTITKLTELSEELDGWTVTIAEAEDRPLIYGLHNVPGPAVPENSEWLQICLLPTEDARYLVIPYLFRPEKSGQLHQDSRLFRTTVKVLSKWEFVPHPDIQVDDISTPFNTIDEAAARVREFCNTLG